MSVLLPRVVLVTRRTELAALLARHSTLGQVEFFLAARGQRLDEVVARDHAQAQALAQARRAVPADWSFAEVLRDDLDRFLFFPNDIVVALGQDGLVPNIAKYLDGQPLIGVAADASRGEGILTTHRVEHLAGILPRAAAGDIDRVERTMVMASVTGGGTLMALNELFVGHRSHKSARYDLQVAGKREFQSSSGLILATGTGMSGWARSLMAVTGYRYDIAPDDSSAAFFSREPWPSRTTGSSLRTGLVDAASSIHVTSRMEDGGVIFADGIEQDYLPFDWGNDARLAIADRHLTMVA
ncbi:hypothetical protein CSC94_14050 [Zhengella mangrovi]|uniref:Sugar kinase n=1 Tax=Zhengella mangrovi TaxID=1982044 RepID=A0A2G1QLK1_9HYPH|nr:hypothetical protein [Zhengella mangrovi]PHP66407.1 hypothetical protein CSC94_14050 [Zhengella mangrovi]